MRGVQRQRVLLPQAAPKDQAHGHPIALTDTAACEGNSDGPTAAPCPDRTPHRSGITGLALEPRPVLFDRKRVAGAEPQADNLKMQRYCSVRHKPIGMRRLSEATRPSDAADPWHFERHTREDHSEGTATGRVRPGSGKIENDARDSW